MAYPSPTLYSDGEPVGIYSPNFEHFGVTFCEMLEETEMSGNQRFSNESPDFYYGDQYGTLFNNYGKNHLSFKLIIAKFHI